jgi:hypothetical protein
LEFNSIKNTQNPTSGAGKWHIIWYSELTAFKLTRFYCSHYRNTMEWGIFIK